MDRQDGVYDRRDRLAEERYDGGNTDEEAGDEYADPDPSIIQYLADGIAYRAEESADLLEETPETQAIRIDGVDRVVLYVRVEIETLRILKVRAAHSSGIDLSKTSLLRVIAPIYGIVQPHVRGTTFVGSESSAGCSRRFGVEWGTERQVYLFE